MHRGEAQVSLEARVGGVRGAENAKQRKEKQDGKQLNDRIDRVCSQCFVAWASEHGGRNAIAQNN
eukprot:5819965-Pleurochrysis_carterae.AAC.2